ncbi:MAG: hypothetical protein WBN32_01060, partial [Woeseia sp.]
ANLDFVIGEETISSQYDLDGQLATRIDILRPKRVWLKPPMHIGAANFCEFRGMLMKSYIYFRGKMGFSLFKKGSASFTIGDHPRVQKLKTLNIRPEPVFTAWFPESAGVLDDYFESWFITHATPPFESTDGLETVADLGRGEEWLDPPNRAEPRSATTLPI